MSGIAPRADWPELKDFDLPRFRMQCRICERRGDYAIERLIARFGATAKIADVMEVLSANCDRRQFPAQLGPCGAHCPDLIYMGNRPPFSPDYGTG